jgi:hypothetical protein
MSPFDVACALLTWIKERRSNRALQWTAGQGLMGALTTAIAALSHRPFRNIKISSLTARNFALEYADAWSKA